MPIEGIAEAVLPIIGRAIGYIFVELLAHIIFYTTGYAVIKVFTLGKYPKEFVALNSAAKQPYHVIFAGLFFWLVIIVCSVVSLSV